VKGVECYGAAYHFSRTVRDLDRLRRAIEERLREDRGRYGPPPAESVEL
jgi:hypothetical protein